MNCDKAYHYGVFLGDGYVERYQPGSGCCYVGLKSIDLDFVEHWRDVVANLTDKTYSIRTEHGGGPNRRPRFRCRVGDRSFVEPTIEDTARKTRVPPSVLEAGPDIHKAFLQGLMDSEGWIRATLNPMGPSRIELCFAVTDDWISDVHEMMSGLGIEVSKIGRRKFKNDPKYLKPRKDLFHFQIDMLGYQDAGMGFNIKRKQDRLVWCSRILRDYTRDYPKYSDYFG